MVGTGFSPYTSPWMDQHGRPPSQPIADTETVRFTILLPSHPGSRRVWCEVLELGPRQPLLALLCAAAEAAGWPADAETGEWLLGLRLPAYIF